jgi:two-component system chemotaxis response regulator CheB
MTRNGKIIRVLVVDDSRLVREMICEILSSEPGIEVVGEAGDGAEAITKVTELKPDIVTMDIEMPVMGGLEAIERIIAECPVPILVVTALTGVRTAFAAVSKGALDVIEKPDITPETAHKLLQKVKTLVNVDMASHLRAVSGRNTGVAEKSAVVLTHKAGERVVAIAASTGGPQAINYILSRLPAGFPSPIVITQHIAEGFTQAMVDWLNNSTPLKVILAANGDFLAPGNVYLNPAEHSMRIAKQGMIILSDKPAGQIYSPSCNTMLESIASSYQGSAIGLILSGMGDDGASGILAIKKAGGFTFAQDEKSSVIYGMNRVAVERGGTGKVLPLSEIADELLRQVGSN